MCNTFGVNTAFIKLFGLLNFIQIFIMQGKENLMARSSRFGCTQLDGRQQWQAKPEGTSLTKIAFGTYLTTVPLDDLCADIQAESQSGCLMNGFLYTVKAFKQIL